MILTPIRVGIIGANPDHGWAFRGHVPALATLPQFEISAVATTREGSAHRAAQITGATQWFTSAEELCASDNVDLVVVTVKVPMHRELVSTALGAGKHVYCEWPLGLDSEEASTLAAMTGKSQGFIGLQARSNPMVVRLRRLIESDQLGAIQLVTAMSSRVKGFSGEVDPASAYTLDARNGAGMLNVLGGHFLDLIDFATGGIAMTDLRSSLFRDRMRLAGSDRLVRVTSPDTAIFAFTVGDAGMGVAAIRDGDPRGGTILTIAGENGTAILQSSPVVIGAAQQPQMAPMTLEFTDKHDRISAWADHDDFGLPVQSQNVAAAYRALAADLMNGTSITPTFDDAVHVHTLLEHSS